MRLNENAHNLPAYAMGFRFFASETALTLSAYGAYYRFDLLSSRFSFMDITVHFRVSLHNIYYQNYR